MEEDLYTEKEVQLAYITGLLVGIGKEEGKNTVDYLSLNLKKGWNHFKDTTLKERKNNAYKKQDPYFSKDTRPTESDRSPS